MNIIEHITKGKGTWAEGGKRTEEKDGGSQEKNRGSINKHGWVFWEDIMGGLTAGKKGKVVVRFIKVKGSGEKEWKRLLTKKKKKLHED